ncbi:MAG TPA: DUF72 domain-containing protein [Terriglobales bacterium]|jgi:uncharacterized protein YecE (DUF72 family)|nr:DUF72 domain-containing protein [Terriglobales bacterium]
MSEPSAHSPLYVGTSGWAYTIWKPDFYPKEVASKNFLKYYATQLTSVEVNYTFRRSLTEKAATGWMADVGPNFRFALKANQYITHIKRLQNVEEAVQRFLPTLQPLATQLGPVLFQLPPNSKADVGVLREFLALLPRSFKAAFEFRHESWFADEVYKALQDHNATLCVAETEKINTPEVRTASYIYFRFRQPSYSAEELKKLADRVERCVADGLETYAFFKHEEDPRSPHNAVELLNTVRKRQES